MIFNRFALLVGLRLLLLLALLSALAATQFERKWLFSVIILSSLIILVVVELLRFINRTNFDLVKLLQALEKDDFSTHFQQRPSGRSFRKLYGAFNNVIDRYKAAQLQQEAQKEFLNIAVSKLNVGVIAHEENGRILIFNEYARSIVGDIIPQNWDILILRKIPVIQFLHNMPTDSPQIYSQDTGAQDQSLLLQASRFSLLQKNIRLYTIKDIRSQLDQKEVESWQKVIRVLTHEIMNSLTPVISLTDMAGIMLNDLDRPKEETQAIKEALDTAQGRAKGLLSFVKSYRQYLKVPTPNLQSESITAFSEQLVQLLSPRLQKAAIHLEYTPTSGLQTMLADQYLLEQVFINLFTNAIQALEGMPTPVIKFKIKQDAQRITFSIRDNGPGIAEEQVSEIFVPFYTSKEDGSGIGLSISRQIVQAHGGRLFVQTQEGKGATFFVELPVPEKLQQI
ncbi:MAG: HAMP domain-containing histidine kinase [Saprospiraceae bacterium]|nr:HAMP domain-containing histidine kinase [Saprospiraceae bacterium]